MDSNSRDHSGNPKRLKTLSCSVAYAGGNNLLHRFVLDNSRPNKLGGKNYITAVLRSMAGVAADVVNAHNGDGYTALHLAVLRKNLLIMKFLLDCLVDIDVDAKTVPKGFEREGSTALHLAAELGHLSITRELLDRGADIDMKNDGTTALCRAINSNCLKVVNLLVNRGANVNRICKFGPPLCYAGLYSRYLEVFELLVNSGADVNLRDGFTTPLCAAVQSRNLAIVEYLVRNGADVNIRDRDNSTPLHCAVETLECSAIAEYLIRNGADINAKYFAGRTALHDAVLMRRFQIVKILLDRGVDVNAEDECNRTPLQCAVKDGQAVFVDILIDRGARVDTNDRRSNTPLHYAVSNRNSDINRLLLSLENGNHNDAVRNEILDYIKLLRHQGTDLYFVNADDKTQLREEDAKIATFMLQKGAPGFADQEFNLADCRRYTDCAKIIQTLLDKGADVKAKNVDGITPLTLFRNESLVVRPSSIFGYNTTM